MAEFSKLTVTSKGKSLIAKSLAGESEIKFPKVATSSAVYDEEELEGLTQLENIQQEEAPSNIVRTSDEVVKIETYFSNLALEIGYHINTIGIYADDPDEGEILYGVSVSTGGSCYMPAYNGVTTSGAVFQISTTVGNAENVSLEVNLAGVATIGQLKDVQDDLEEKIDDVEGKVDDVQSNLDEAKTELGNQITETQTELTNQITVAKTELTADITAEATARETADEAEATARQTADEEIRTEMEEQHVFCTQSEYDALPDTKLTDGKIYFISTGGVIRNGIQYATMQEATSDSAGLMSASDKEAVDGLTTEGISIENLDLNDLTTPGKYYSNNGTTTGSLTNCPFTTYAFGLWVLKSTSVRTAQIIITHRNGGEMYFRADVTLDWKLITATTVS